MPSNPPARVSVLLFAAARQAAGTRRWEVEAATPESAVGAAREHFGPDFSAVADRCRVWVNGEPADPGAPLRDGDEVALLPPVSGGGVP